MTKDQIINHPDAFHFLTVAHAGAASIVEDLNSCNPEGNLIVIDDAHPKYSKIYILDSPTVYNLQDWVDTRFSNQ